LSGILFVSAASAADRAKNVILFLGDAGGLATLHAASIHAHGDAQKLFVQRMPNVALSETSSATDWVSDSAAGMTAIVTGQKTLNGVLSLSPDTVRGKTDGAPLKTILEYAEERGLSTGVITNDAITGATPAACYAHVNERNSRDKIFSAALSPRFGDGVDLMIGAGRTALLAAMEKAGIDLPAELAKRSYHYATALDGLSAGKRRAIILLDDAEFDLGIAVKRAVDILSKNPKGFFLMVESDLHTNRMIRGLGRAARFDGVIEETTRRMRSNTLVLFTADHSFDLRISGNAAKGQPIVTAGPKGEDVLAKGLTVFGHHSAEPVVVTADGPGSERVKGFLSNTDLFTIMMSAYGWPIPKQAVRRTTDN
jgi:alkaline phosphatase